VEEDPKILIENMYAEEQARRQLIEYSNDKKFEKRSNEFIEYAKTNTKVDDESKTKVLKSYDNDINSLRMSVLLYHLLGSISVAMISILLAQINHKQARTIKSNGYMSLTIGGLKMLDILNYLSPTSYTVYLEAYTCGCKCEDKISCLCGLGKGTHTWTRMRS
jgi:hypothetical protein